MSCRFGHSRPTFVKMIMQTLLFGREQSRRADLDTMERTCWSDEGRLPRGVEDFVVQY